MIIIFQRIRIIRIRIHTLEFIILIIIWKISIDHRDTCQFTEIEIFHFEKLSRIFSARVEMTKLYVQPSCNCYVKMSSRTCDVTFSIMLCACDLIFEISELWYARPSGCQRLQSFPFGCVEVWSPDVGVERGLRETDGQLGMECVCTDSRLNLFPCFLYRIERTTMDCY